MRSCLMCQPQLTRRSLIPKFLRLETPLLLNSLDINLCNLCNLCEPKILMRNSWSFVLKEYVSLPVFINSPLIISELQRSVSDLFIAGRKPLPQMNIYKRLIISGLASGLRSAFIDCAVSDGTCSYQKLQFIAASQEIPRTPTKI